MIMRSLLLSCVLLALLAACGGAALPAADPVREEAAVYSMDGNRLAAAHLHGFERAFRAAAQE